MQEMIRIHVHEDKGISHTIHISPSATIPELYSEIAKVTNRPIDGFHIKSGIYFIKKFKLGTVDDNSIYNKSSIHIVDRIISQQFDKKSVKNSDNDNCIYGACLKGIMIKLPKHAATDCADPEQCPFYEHELYNQLVCQEVAKQREDTYDVVCEAFNLTQQITQVIEDATASNSLRFSDTLHHLYHKDHSMTWGKIITEVSIIDHSLAQIISNSVQ